MNYRKIHQEEPKVQYHKQQSQIYISKNPNLLPINVLKEKDCSLSKSSELKNEKEQTKGQEIQQLK